MAIDADELKRLLKERRRDSSRVVGGTEVKTSIGDSIIKEVVKTRDGETAYEVEKRVTANPYSTEQKEETTRITPRCEACGEPIVPEMFARGDIKPCLICGRKTCPGCRANTDLHELKPQVRGQPVCLECWNSGFVAEKLLMKCPSCGHPVRDNYDIKTCIGWCERKICPSCGIQAELGGLVCRHCYPKYSSLKEELSSWPAR